MQRNDWSVRVSRVEEVGGIHDWRRVLPRELGGGSRKLVVGAVAVIDEVKPRRKETVRMVARLHDRTADLNLWWRGTRRRFWTPCHWIGGGGVGRHAALGGRRWRYDERVGVSEDSSGG